MGKKLKIAVTGGIGSGKSIVCSVFSEGGFPVISSDDIAKELLKNDEQVKQKIIAAFGKESYKEGAPNTKYLAGKVFSNPEKVNQINSIVHPPTITFINKRMDEELKNHKLVFVESALIFEAEMEKDYDYILLVTSDDKNKIKRAVERGKVSEEEVKKRMANQIPDSQKKDHADFVIENNSSLEELKSKSRFFLKLFEQMAG